MLRFYTSLYTEEFKISYNKIKEVNPDENASLAGARLFNKELYLLKKFSCAVFYSQRRL